MVGAAATPSGEGYWLTAADGGVFAFGDAKFHGSSVTRGTTITGVAATPSGRGYWLTSTTGRVFGHGDAGVDPAVVLRPASPVVAVIPG